MKQLISSCLLAVLALMPVSSMGANVQFKGKSGPTFNDKGQTLETCLSLSGLGNQDVTITVKAAGTITTICTNPGGNVAPGLNKVPTTTLARQTIPSTQIKNGNLSVCLTTAIPATPTPKEAGCPNNNFTVVIEDVTFTSAEVTVEQGGAVVLSKTFGL